jgi:hypothetical protein
MLLPGHSAEKKGAAPAPLATGYAGKMSSIRIGSLRMRMPVA